MCVALIRSHGEEKLARMLLLKCSFYCIENEYTRLEDILLLIQATASWIHVDETQIKDTSANRKSGLPNYGVTRFKHVM